MEVVEQGEWVDVTELDMIREGHDSMCVGSGSEWGKGSARVSSRLITGLQLHQSHKAVSDQES